MCCTAITIMDGSYIFFLYNDAQTVLPHINMSQFGPKAVLASLLACIIVRMMP